MWFARKTFSPTTEISNIQCYSEEKKYVPTDVLLTLGTTLLKLTIFSFYWNHKTKQDSTHGKLKITLLVKEDTSFQSEVRQMMNMLLNHNLHRYWTAIDTTEITTFKKSERFHP